MVVVCFVLRCLIGFFFLVYFEILMYFFKILVGIFVLKFLVVSYEGLNNMWVMYMLINRVEFVIFFKFFV